MLIILGGSRFVDAAVAIAKKLGAGELVIGATVVSIGTTLPEVLVSTAAGLRGSADIAVGNAFGSIICNTALIAGLTQLIRPSADIGGRALGWRVFFFYAAGAVCLAFGLGSGFYGRAAGLILLGLFLVYVCFSLSGRSAPAGAPEPAPEKTPPMFSCVLVLAVTAAMLCAGSRLLVDNGAALARLAGVPERVIGVTFIALGTSLPELATAVTALAKGHVSVSVGNIVGANLLNFLLVIGIPAALCGVAPSRPAVTFDLPLALGAMAVLTVPMLVKKRGFRLQGALLLAGYAAYCALQF